MRVSQSLDMQLTIGLNKCATAVMQKGKAVEKDFTGTSLEGLKVIKPEEIYMCMGVRTTAVWCERRRAQGSPLNTAPQRHRRNT